MSQDTKHRPATPIAPAWGTAKSLGATDGSVLTFYGTGTSPERRGVKVRVSRPEGRIALHDAKTGELVLVGGAALKFWGRPMSAKAAGGATGKATAGAVPPSVDPSSVARAAQTPGPPGAAWLRIMREAGLSQTETARRMGVAAVTLNRLVNGRGIPTARITVRFAYAVGADPRVLWGQVCDYELEAALAERRGARGQARRQ